MGRSSGPRFPFAALAAAMGVSEHRAATLLGGSGSQGVEWRRHGLTMRTADRLATRAGFHPAIIWPHYYDADLAEIDAQERERAELAERDAADRERARLEDKRRRDREYQARRRATPEGAAANRERVRAYRASLPPGAVARAERVRYQADPQAGAARKRVQRARRAATSPGDGRGSVC